MTLRRIVGKKMVKKVPSKRLPNVTEITTPSFDFNVCLVILKLFTKY